MLLNGSLRQFHTSLPSVAENCLALVRNQVGSSMLHHVALIHRHWRLDLATKANERGVLRTASVIFRLVALILAVQKQLIKIDSIK